MLLILLTQRLYRVSGRNNRNGKYKGTKLSLNRFKERLKYYLWTKTNEDVESDNNQESSKKRTVGKNLTYVMPS